MARDWNLQETKALVKEHIYLKAEQPEMLTASERWNKVAETLREKGFNRSHRSCKKRWYRLEQYEVQIFSFNMEDGKNKNYWDLTRAERLKFRGKWPQLPSGDAIDRELFDSLKRFSHVYEKDTSKTASNASTTVANVEDKEVIHSEPKLEARRKSSSPQPLISTPLSTSAPSVSQLLSSQEVLDGLKLQDLELRGRRAVELWKNKTTLPCTNKASTFVEINQPLQQKAQTPKRPLIPERTLFGSIKISPSPDVTHTTMQGDNSTRVVRENVTYTKSPIQFKRVNPPQNSFKVDGGPVSQNQSNSTANVGQQTTGNYLNIQSQNTNIGRQQGGQLPLLHSITSNLPFLQTKEKHMIQKKGASSYANYQNFPEDYTLPVETLQPGSFEKQSAVILCAQPVTFKTGHNCEQQLHGNMDLRPQFRRCMPGRPDHEENDQELASSLLNAAIEGLEVQLGAIVKLIQAKHEAELEFKEKMILFSEFMVVSLHTMAQASARSTSS